MISKKDKTIIQVIIALTIIINFIVALQTYNIIKKMNGNPAEIVYHGKSNSDLKYKVFLKESEYVTEEDDIDSYITNLIDKMNFEFLVNYEIIENIKVNYSYDIIGKLLIYYEGEKERLKSPIVSKKYEYLKDKQMEVNNKITVNEILDFNYNEYNEFVNNFENEFNIPINSYFELVFNIEMKVKNKNKESVKNHQLTATIPLGTKVLDINLTKTIPEEETVYLNPPKNREKIYFDLIVNIFIIMFITGINIFIIKRIYAKYKSEYIKIKEKVLKDYSDRIIEVTNFINYQNWEIIDVVSFDELLELSDESFEPIIFWEKRVGTSKESWFNILKDGVIYRFILQKNKAN